MPSKSFRQRVIKRIMTEGNFHMGHWTVEIARQRDCGTACCLAGNILAEAGYDSYDDIPSDLISSPGYAGAARNIWADHYGQAEANRLNFFLEKPGVHFNQTPPEYAVEHLMAIRTRQ